MLDLGKQTSGYKLYYLGEKYKLVYGSKSYMGSLHQVCAYAVIQLGFDLEELEVGVLEMEKHSHNVAEYGVMKGFMFTFEEKMDAKTIMLH